ncbi:thiamine phosphate synthase [Rickettsiales bacterium]|nr:thiamine phosphate synthase [Rickettsiales bacterium]
MSKKIYLVSPPKINLEDFALKLSLALETNKISLFQLRLKNLPIYEIEHKANILSKICQKYNVPFILNDNFDLALKVGADGVHLGGADGQISNIKNSAPKNFIIGTSCYDSKDRITESIKNNVDYISLGAFFNSKTKKSAGKPDLDLIKYCKDITNIPIICIGGIDNKNYQPLIDSGADQLAIISYIWGHSKGIKYAIESFLF